MESGDPSASSADRPPQRLADFVGTAIALLTLTLPIWVIARYSPSSSIETLPLRSYPLQGLRD